VRTNSFQCHTVGFRAINHHGGFQRAPWQGGPGFGFSEPGTVQENHHVPNMVNPQNGWYLIMFNAQNASNDQKVRTWWLSQFKDPSDTNFGNQRPGISWE
jgi:hypothetical protein